MFKHYLSTAIRNLKRFRLTTSVNVLVLALGLACFIGARSVVMYFGMGDRHIPNYDRVYFVADTIALDRESGGRMIETRTAPKTAEQWPLAYLFMREYLNVYSHRIDITPTLFVAALLIALGVAALAVGAQTWRAARLKPADVLRHE